MVGGFIRWDQWMEGSPSQDGKEVAERGAFAPVVEYDDGSHAFGLPGLITEPWQAMKRWLGGGAEENVARMRTGLPFTPEAVGDALSVAGPAALWSVAAPKPAIGTNMADAVIAKWKMTKPDDSLSMYMSPSDDAAYLAARVVPSESSSIHASKAYEQYRKWAAASGKPMMSERDFGNMMEDNGFSKQHIAGAQRFIGADYAPQRDFVNAAQFGKKVNGWKPIGNINSMPEAMPANEASIGLVRLHANTKESAGLNAAIEGQKQGIRADDIEEILRKYGIAGAASLYGVSSLDVQQALADGGQAFAKDDVPPDGAFALSDKPEIK